MAWAQGQPSLQERFQEGVKAFQAGQFQKSLELFQQVHKDRPTHALVNFYLGVTLKALGRSPEAASFLAEALARDPELKETHYHLGVTYYQTKQFEKALAAFQAAQKSFPKQGVLYYYEGLILLELNRPEEALGPLSKAGELDAAFRTRTTFLRGVAHFRLGQAEEAKAAFREVKTLEPDSPLVGDAEKNLAALDVAARPPKRFSFTLSSGFQYNDNVILEPNGFSILAGGTPTGPPVNTRIEDGVGNVSFRGEYRHPLGERLEAGVSYATYAAFHSNLSSFNLNSHNPGAYLGFRYAPFYLRAEYDYLFSFFGSKSSVSFHSVGPTLYFSPHPLLMTQVQYRFKDKTFFANRGRDSDAHVITANQFFYILGPGGYVRLGYQYEDENSRREAYESEASVYSGGLLLPLPWDVSFATNASFENREYDNDFFSLGVRDEDLLSVSTTFSKKLWDGVGVSLSYTLMSNDSNIGDFDYDQNIYGVNVTYEY
jgi:tetratricopeptide (TPR) repeat protein